MKLKRKVIGLSHAVRFPRPAAALAVHGGRLIELLLEELTAYAISSRDISFQTTPAGGLESWQVRLTMFNGLGTVAITVDGFSANFANLVADADLKTVLDVQTHLTVAMSRCVPTLKYQSEQFGGNLHYTAVDGAAVRSAYFSRMTFPNRSERHRDAAFKFRMASDANPSVLGSVEIAPIWVEDDGVLVTFVVDTSSLTSAALEARAKIAGDIVEAAMTSVGLSVVDKTS